MLICVLPINENTVTYIFHMARWQMLVKSQKQPNKPKKHNNSEMGSVCKKANNRTV